MEMFYLLFFFQQQQLQHSQQQMQQIQQPPQHSPPQNTSPSSSQHTQPQAKQGGTHHLEQQPQPARPQTLSPHAESIWGSGASSQASPCKCHSVSLCLYCSSLSKHSLGDEWSRCLKMLVWDWCISWLQWIVLPDITWRCMCQMLIVCNKSLNCLFFFIVSYHFTWPMVPCSNNFSWKRMGQREQVSWCIVF